MNVKKLDKPVKSVVLNGCAFQVTEEDDGLVINVIPLEEDKEGNLHLKEIKGACRSVIDIWGNLVGCKDVGACDKECMICTIYDDDGNELGESCGCREKCPEPPDNG